MEATNDYKIRIINHSILTWKWKYNILDKMRDSILDDLSGSEEDRVKLKRSLSLTSGHSSSRSHHRLRGGNKYGYSELTPIFIFDKEPKVIWIHFRCLTNQNYNLFLIKYAHFVTFDNKRRPRTPPRRFPTTLFHLEAIHRFSR